MHYVTFSPLSILKCLLFCTQQCSGNVVEFRFYLLFRSEKYYLTFLSFFSLGIQKTDTGQWIYTSSKGSEPTPCHTDERSLLETLLAVLRVELLRGKCAGGHLLVSLLNDDSLLYLVAAVTRHGLLGRLLELVAAVTSLEVLFRQLGLAKRSFGLKFLDKYCKTAWKDPKVWPLSLFLCRF